MLRKASFLLLLSASPLISQASRDSVPSDSARRLAPVVTTATRTPVSSELVARRLDVIGREALEQVSYLDAADVLKKEAGADVIQFGGMLSGVGLRGFRPQNSGITPRTLLLVDGRPAGVSNAALLDLGDAESIEVLHGPASALYGSSAMGGVINVIRQRRSGKLGGTIRAGAGSFGATDLRVEGGGALWSSPDGRQFDAEFSAQRVEQSRDYRVGDGSALRDMVGSGEALLVSGDDVIGPTPDAGAGARRTGTTFLYHTAGARAGWAFGNGMRVDVRADLQQADDIETPGDIHFADSPFPGNGRKNLRRWSGDVAIGGTHGRHSPMLRAYHVEEASEYFDHPDAGRFVNFITDVYTRGFQLQDVISFGSQSLIAGVDLTRTDADSRRLSSPGAGAPPYSPNAARTSMAAFGEWRWQAAGGRLTGTVGARADRVSLELKETALRPDVAAGTEHFDVITPSAAVLLRLTNGVSLRASAGRAFVAPDAFARAGLTTTTGQDGRVAFAVGNPALDPESSVTLDGGVVLNSEQHGLQLDMGYFHTRVDDRITPAVANFDETSAPTTPGGQRVARVETRVNAAEATMRGLEARFSWDAGLAFEQNWSLRLFANGTRLLDAEERVRAVAVDASRLENVTEFTPDQAFAAIVFGDDSSVRIKNVARSTITAGVAWDDLQRFRARLSARYVGERRDLDFVSFANDVLYPAFLVADLSLGARILPSVRADLLVSNLTDENYYEIRGYNLPGRSFTLRLTAGF